MAISRSDIEWCWSQARIVYGRDSRLWRKDEMGNLLYKPAYGKRGQFGWHIDHRKPRALGGTDHRRNLRVLYWKANISKGSRY